MGFHLTEETELVKCVPLITYGKIPCLIKLVLFISSLAVNRDQRVQDKNTLFSLCSVSPVYLQGCIERQPPKSLPASTTTKAADPTSKTDMPGFDMNSQHCNTTMISHTCPFAYKEKYQYDSKKYLQKTILNQDLTYHVSPKKVCVLLLTRWTQIPKDCDWFICKLSLMQGNFGHSPAFISPFFSHPTFTVTSLTSTLLGRLHSFRGDLAIPLSLVNFSSQLLWKETWENSQLPQLAIIK